MRVELGAIQRDSSIQCRAEIDVGVVSDYAERMKAGDEFPPVDLYGTRDECWIGDGWHRVHGAETNQQQDIEANLRPGGRVDALRHALRANAIHGRRRTNADKRRCVEIALKEFGKLSSRAIADMCGVSNNFISEIRQVSSDDTSRSIIGRDGKQYPSTKPNTLSVDVSDKVSEEPRSLDMDDEPESCLEVDVSSKQPDLGGHVDLQDRQAAELPHVAHNSGENEWYTPSDIVEDARTCMGGIDLDPASCAEANKVVKAKAFFSKADDGLAKDWAGMVWLNPPYEGSLIGKFMDKLASSVNSGEVTQAVVLINNGTETRWFATLAGVSSMLCFPTGRIKFWHPDRESFPLQGQCIAYIGDRKEEFEEAFKEYGIVVEVRP